MPFGIEAPTWRDRLCAWISAVYPTRRLTTSRRARRGYAWLLRVLWPQAPVAVRLRDYRLWLHPRRDDLARTLVLGGPWEPLESAALRDALRPGDTLLDVGANVGHYTLLGAGAVGPRGRVIAFEPAPEPFAALEANVRLNGYGTVTCVRAACAAHDGTVTLHLDAANAGGHSLGADSVQAAGGRIAVPAVGLDAWLARHAPEAPVRVLKSDAQGAELAVLRGAEALLRAQRPLLLLEFWPYGLQRCGAGAEALLRLLADLGYALEVLHEPSSARYAATPERLLADFPAHVAWAFTTLRAVSRSG